MDYEISPERESMRPSRRTIVQGAAWTVPAIAVAAGAPLAAASGTAIQIIGVSPSLMAGGTVSSVAVTATGNTGPVTFTLPPGFTWTDGTPSGAPRTIGTGPGTFAVPPFTVSSTAGPAVFTAALSDGTTATAATTVIAQYAINLLGAAQVTTNGPDEFRADFTLLVPAGVRPTKLQYTYDPDDSSPSLNTLSQLADVQTDVDQQYGIVAVQTQSDGSELLYISARGDADVNSHTSGTYPVSLIATWPDGSTSSTSYPVLVINRDDDAGRPVGIIAWDSTVSGDPASPHDNSQTSWGNNVPAGSSAGLNGQYFIVDAINSGNHSSVGNDLTTSLYYQFVRGDNGQPASITPTPVLMNIADHSSWEAENNRLTALGTNFQLDDPGYYRLLVWPQTSSSQGGFSSAGVAWDPSVLSEGQQLGSVFWKIPTTV